MVEHHCCRGCCFLLESPFNNPLGNSSSTRSARVVLAAVQQFHPARERLGNSTDVLQGVRAMSSELVRRPLNGTSRGEGLGAL